jgi:DNA-binding NarL/FixJ family response regulator
VSTPQSSGLIRVLLCERDPARRLALGGLIRHSRHLTLIGSPRDDRALLEWLELDVPADVLCTGESICVHRADRYALLERVRALRPDLPIVFAMGTETAPAVERGLAEALSLVSTRDTLAHLHEALLTAASGERYVSPPLQSLLEEPPLSERQVEILQRMARGEGRPEIARALGVSENTVRSHTKELYRRLGVNERAHAVAIGLRDVVIMPPRRGDDAHRPAP